MMGLAKLMYGIRQMLSKMTAVFAEIFHTWGKKSLRFKMLLSCAFGCLASLMVLALSLLCMGS